MTDGARGDTLDTVALTTKRTLKFLHEVGTVGLMGGAAAQLILSYAAEGQPPVEYAAVRVGALLVSKWLLLPSLLLVLASGLFAMAAHRGFMNAPWAWIKAALTIVVLEGTLLGVQGPAVTAAEVSAEIASGDLSSAHLLPDIVGHERGGIAVILFLSIVNIWLAVWRPRLGPRRARASEPPEPESVESESEPEAKSVDGADAA